MCDCDYDDVKDLCVLAFQAFPEEIVHMLMKQWWEQWELENEDPMVLFERQIASDWSKSTYKWDYETPESNAQIIIKMRNMLVRKVLFSLQFAAFSLRCSTS
jgi:hypothetical protein